MSGSVSAPPTTLILLLIPDPAPTSIPDSDDTAKTIMALRHLGKIVSVDALVEAFESEDHFRTYERERNPSFTSNCNVLTCLCMLEDPLPYALQISKAAKFLCSQVSGGNVRDKWVGCHPQLPHASRLANPHYDTGSTFMTCTG